MLSAALSAKDRDFLKPFFFDKVGASSLSDPVQKSSEDKRN